MLLTRPLMRFLRHFRFEILRFFYFRLGVLGVGEGAGVQIPVGVCVDGAHFTGTRIGVLSEPSPSLLGSAEIDVQIWALNEGVPVTSSLEASRVLQGEQIDLELHQIRPGQFTTKAPVPPCNQTAELSVKLYDNQQLVAQFPTDGQRTFTAFQVLVHIISILIFSSVKIILNLFL